MSNRIAIIMLHWNDEPATTKCLRMLSTWKQVNCMIFVVDNNTKIRYKLPTFSGPNTILMASESNRGYAGGNNFAMHAAMKADFDFALLLNTDLEVKEEVVQSMMETMNRDLSLGAIGPALVEGSQIHVGGLDVGLHQNTRILQKNGGAVERNVQLAYIPGTIFLTRFSVVQKVGLLDERYFYSGEIADFCRRILDAGYRIMADASVRAVHHKLNNITGRKLATYYSLRNRFLYVEKHHRNIRNRLRFRWIVVGLQQIFGALLRFDAALARTLTLAVYDGIRGRYGNMNHRFIP